MNPVSGLNAPTAIISRSDSGRIPSRTAGSPFACSASAAASWPVASLSTSCPPWGSISPSLIAAFAHPLVLVPCGSPAWPALERPPPFSERPRLRELPALHPERAPESPLPQGEGQGEEEP